ncbi:MAG TPA: DUF4398 domain-containing protein [Chiayiivirga sp.]|nr:DUF4398 domain-containing protein [Chiayiivirga sp.]
MLIIFVMLIGCATTPPSRAGLDSLHDQIADARDLGAQSYAPVELNRASQLLAAAEAAFSERDYDVSDRNAARAELEVQLAQARSRAATLREKVRELSDENQRLRRELLGEGTLR